MSGTVLRAIIAKVGALAINIATLVCLLVLSWPSEAALGF